MKALACYSTRARLMHCRLGMVRTWAGLCVGMHGVGTQLELLGSRVTWCRSCMSAGLSLGVGAVCPWRSAGVLGKDHVVQASSTWGRAFCRSRIGEISLPKLVSRR